jgi:RND superfamily putative drug exporter
MILVFSAFILSGQQVVGEIGLGMAAAVLLDAFLLRTLLVPALMHLSGRANWWLPGWLDRALPHLSIEPATPPAAQTAALVSRAGRTNAAYAVPTSDGAARCRPVPGPPAADSPEDYGRQRAIPQPPPVAGRPQS